MAPRTAKKKGDALDEYRRKRSQGATPEPFGEPAPSADRGVGGLFVVQKHAARRTHYDLRMEMDGVLKSWAVPKGPSLDPEEKRLAVETEDHPMQYGDFEGVIPEGNYGAGAMIVWDRGTWVPIEEPKSGYDSGKLLFELRGYKLRGVWTLFRTKPPAIHRGKSRDEARQWLLVKKPDEAARPGDQPELPEHSVLSGLLVEELGAGAERIHELRVEIEELGLPRRKLDPRKFNLMLAKQCEQPFSDPDWLYELKYDGYRLLCAVRENQAFLRYRNGHDATHLYPEILRVLESLPVEAALLDGEVTVLDGARPSFAALQKRALLSRALDIEQASIRGPATLFAFDLLSFEDSDLRGLPLRQRKDLLRRLLPPAGSVRYCDHIEGRGEDFYEQIAKMGLEGMMAKRAESKYSGRRSDEWLKLRVDRTADFVIVGFTRPKGHRTGFGALHLAHWSPEEGEPPLLYSGRVGTGFNEALLRELSERMAPNSVDQPPCRGEMPSGPRHQWVEPELVCEVRYKEWTPQGMLRHPVFQRLRDDKSIEQCTSEAHAPADAADAPPTPKPSEPPPKLQFTNWDKVFWPDEGYTKGDLIDYYRAVAPTMLPYLIDRPIVLTRYPDGIYGKSFFQKNAPDFAPDWIRTEEIWSEGSERDIEYFICNDEDTLLYLANLGAIVLHVWSSRLEMLDRPDWCILDLDPKEAPFSSVVTVAREIHRLCNEIELPTFVKSSGSSGLHVLIPLGNACSYEQSRTLGMLIAQLVSRTLSDIATINRNVERRDGKVYIDFVQNGHGRLLVAPFSARAKKGGAVSAPLRWSEVNGKLDIDNYTIKTVPRRLKRQRSDPLAGVLSTKPDLVAALERLSSKLN